LCKPLADWLIVYVSVAVLDVKRGASCDEINERSYCSQGLVCHKCPGDTHGYKCVQCKSLTQRRHVRTEPSK